MDIHEAQSAWPWEMTAVRCPSPAKPPDAEQVVPPGQEAAHSARRQPLWSAVLCALQRFAVSSRTSQVGGVLGRQQTCSPSCSLLLALVAGHRGNGIHVVLVELGYLRRATGVPSAAGGSPPNPFPFVPFVRFVAVPLFGRCASFPQARRPRMDNRDRLPEARSVAVRGFARCIPDLAVRGSGTAWRGHCWSWGRVGGRSRRRGRSRLLGEGW